ncbi:MAG: MXAN_5187 C-terminal domain-containing protein [Acidobacteriota bacterium]
MKNLLKTPVEPSALNKQVDQEIDRLAGQIRRFRVDSQRFFAGDLKLPPDDLRERIGTELRRLRSSSLKGARANFRLGTLEAQFQSHLDLYGRRLRAREQGQAPAKPVAKKPEAQPEQGVIFGMRDNTAAVQALYGSLHQRNPKMSYEKFNAYINRQAEAIRSKTGCREIQFRIAVQDGKTKLKAKPMRRGAQR